MYRGGKEFSLRDHTIVTCIKVLTIFYRYGILQREMLLILQPKSKISKLASCVNVISYTGGVDEAGRASQP
jgi:hypothetical protein